MEQERHTDADRWVTPLGSRALLVELDVKDKTEGSNLELPQHQRLQTLSKGTVRGVSPKLPDVVAENWLPDGLGSFGERVLVAKEAVNTWDEPTYRMCGLEPPHDNENRGILGFVNIERVIAKLEPSEHLPFTPVGTPVFFEYDYKEGTGRYVGAESGEVYEPGEEMDEIAESEDSRAAKNQFATVLGVGDGVDILETRDRIVVGRFADSINYEGTSYPFVTSPDQIRGRIENPDADIELEKSRKA